MARGRSRHRRRPNRQRGLVSTLSTSHSTQRDAAQAARRRPYAPPELAEIGSLQERTLSSVEGMDGHHFNVAFGLPFKTSVHCVNRRSPSVQAAGDHSGHIGFTLPDAV